MREKGTHKSEKSLNKEQRKKTVRGREKRLESSTDPSWRRGTVRARVLSCVAGSWIDLAAVHSVNSFRVMMKALDRTVILTIKTMDIGNINSIEERVRPMEG